MAEAGADYSGRADQITAARLRTHSSSLIARILEYQLVGAIGAELLARGLTFEVLKSDVDADGYDLIIEANGVVRHIQLKAKVQGGKARKVTCHTRLAAKPSGCIIALTYNAASYQTIEYACFGGLAGDPLPDIGSSVARRSTHNRAGERPQRTGHRDIRLSEFRKISSIPELVDWLFWPSALSLLNGHPFPISAATDNGWSVFPISIIHTDGTALVVLAGNGSETALALDLIGGRWSTGSELDDDPEVQAVLAKAVQQLAPSLDPQHPGKVYQ
jgi:hypothetical protein